ncbi:MAG: hypothetical protein IJU81_02565 [Bacteroidales bacterium]|nr:hypothetical protein [Bacteroidales bacterium]
MKKLITDNISVCIILLFLVALAALAISLKNRRQLNPPSHRPDPADTTAPTAAETPADQASQSE